MRETVGRFAPTPSGFLHAGNLLCALIAWLSVRSQGGRFLLRIEDLDRPRCTDELTRQCIEDLKALGLDWDGPILYQSQRTPIYEEHLRRLESQGLTYPCFCTRAMLHSLTAPNQGDTQYIYPGTCARLTEEEVKQLSIHRTPSIRFRVPDREMVFSDRLQGLYRENPAKDCGDFVLRRSDGLFGYQLAVVVDDALSGVTEVVRGRDILSSTPRQICLYQALGYPVPEYAHIPLMTDSQGRRLAKRDADIRLVSLKNRYSVPWILGMLGCSCGLLEEIAPVSLDDLIRVFSWDRIREKQSFQLFFPDASASLEGHARRVISLK